MKSISLVLILLTGLLFFLLFNRRDATAQNLCPNPGFELVNPCPSALSQLSNAVPWNDAVGSFSTSDIFNACHLNNMPLTCQDVGVPANFCGNAMAHTGDGYSGLIGYYGSLLREYIQAPLDSALDPGIAYHVEVYIRRASLCRFAIDRIGILLTTGPANQNGSNNIALIPQVETNAIVSDTASWTLLSGFYIATGGENFITIGNFRDNNGIAVVDFGLQGSSCTLPNASAYYYLDDVKVERINEKVQIVGDTLICPGDTITLAANSNVATWWSLGDHPNDTLSLAGTVTVSPAVTTTYILNGILIKDSVTVYVIPPPQVNLGNDTTICDGFSLTLNAANPGCTYFWSTGETDSVINVRQNNLYWVIADNKACVIIDSIRLVVLNNPPVNLGPDSVFCLEQGSSLFLDAGAGSGYFWLPTGDTTRILEIKNEFLYSVKVQHDNGCETADSITAIEICPVSLFVPQAFTPNGDGRNEFFLPIVQNQVYYEFSVFNRWGTRLFSTTNPDFGWDGTFKGNKVAGGSYVYWIRYGSVTDSERIDKKTESGIFELIR